MLDHSRLCQFHFFEQYKVNHSAIPGTIANDASVRERVSELLAQMTLDEKIGQMTQIVKDSIGKDVIVDYFLGSVLSGGGGHPYINNLENWVAMTDGFQADALTTRLGIPIVYGLDAIHGRAEMYGATVFPQPIGLGATRDEDLVRRIGQATAQEMLAAGVQWNFSPIIAVPRTFAGEGHMVGSGETTNLVSKLGVAYLQGLQNLPEGYTAAGGRIFLHWLPPSITWVMAVQPLELPSLPSQKDTCWIRVICDLTRKLYGNYSCRHTRRLSRTALRPS